MDAEFILQYCAIFGPRYTRQAWYCSRKFYFWPHRRRDFFIKRNVPLFSITFSPFNICSLSHRRVTISITFSNAHSISRKFFVKPLARENTSARFRLSPQTPPRSARFGRLKPTPPWRSARFRRSKQTLPWRSARFPCSARIPFHTCMRSFA